MDARRAGRWLLAIGIPLAAIGAVLVAIVLNWLPLEAILPDTVRVTGPVVADWRATFWVGFVFVLGLVAIAQGAWQSTRGRGGWRLFALLLAIGVALLGAAVLARA